jgi:predicted phage gp36 major capsid-like protein
MTTKNESSEQPRMVHHNEEGDYTGPIDSECPVCAKRESEAARGQADADHQERNAEIHRFFQAKLRSEIDALEEDLAAIKADLKEGRPVTRWAYSDVRVKAESIEKMGVAYTILGEGVPQAKPGKATDTAATAAKERHDALAYQIHAFRNGIGNLDSLRTAMTEVEKAGEHKHTGWTKGSSASRPGSLTGFPYGVGKDCPGGDCLVNEARGILVLPGYTPAT